MAVSQNKVVTLQTPKTATAVVDTASTDLDDAPTTSVLLVTFGANGGRLMGLTAVPRATVTATRLDMWLSKDSGTTKRLIDTALMAAHTVAATTEIPTTDFGYSPDNYIDFEAADRIYMSTAVTLAGGIVICAKYAEY